MYKLIVLVAVAIAAFYIGRESIDCATIDAFLRR